MRIYCKYIANLKYQSNKFWSILYNKLTIKKKIINLLKKKKKWSFLTENYFQYTNYIINL